MEDENIRDCVFCRHSLVCRAYFNMKSFIYDCREEYYVDVKLGHDAFSNDMIELLAKHCKRFKN